MWQAIIYVFAGSGLGGVLRYLVAVLMKSRAPQPGEWMLPWSTLTVNVAGCFLFGVIYGLSMRSIVSEQWRLALTTGLCGGLTTFSTFSYETVTLFSQGYTGQALGYVLVSVVSGVLAAWLGFAVSR